MGYKYELKIWTQQVNGSYAYEGIYYGNNVFAVLGWLWKLRKMGNAKKLMIR